MSEQENTSAIARLIEGGLPQVIAGPAGKALSRLIGAAVDIPVEWLAGISQGLIDKREARTFIYRAMSNQAAQMVVSDPDTMERAMHSMLGKEYRRQVNKEAVARVALEHIQEESVLEASSGPSDDWMNVFERHAEDASSEHLREMFGRLLAGEIMKPGTVSRAGLHMVSTLDGDSAALIRRVLSLCDESGMCYLDCIYPPLRVVDITDIEQAGFWSSEKTLPLNQDRAIGLDRVDKKTIFLQFGAGSSPTSLNIALLSRAGKDLRNAAGVPFDHASLARRLSALGVVNLRKITIIGEGEAATVSEEVY